MITIVTASQTSVRLHLHSEQNILSLWPHSSFNIRLSKPATSGASQSSYLSSYALQDIIKPWLPFHQHLHQKYPCNHRPRTHGLCEISACLISNICTWTLDRSNFYARQRHIFGSSQVLSHYVDASGFTSTWMLSLLLSWNMPFKFCKHTYKTKVRQSLYVYLHAHQGLANIEVTWL